MNQKSNFTSEEDSKCRQVAALFSDFLREKGRSCVAKAEGYGYIVMFDIKCNWFESSPICSNATELYQELVDTWEAEYLYRTGIEHGCTDFESSEEALTLEQRTYREEKRKQYHREFERILQAG